MSSIQHAVIEVSADEITFRVGSHWLRFSGTTMHHDNDAPVDFALQENGTVRIQNGPEEEMDMAAERLAREMMAK